MEEIHAVLISGQLRTIDDNLFQFLDSCKANSKIFVITDRDFEKQAQIISERYDADISFIEELSTRIDIGIPRSQLNIFHPEFIKLDYALRYLLLWEQSNNHCFQYIHRFRTDVRYPISFDEYVKPLVQADFPENMLLLYWTINYGGPREVMLKLLGFLDYYYKYKTDKEFFKEVITQVDVEALTRSEYDPVDHFGKCFPVGFLSSEDKIADFDLIIKNEYSSYIEATVSFIKRIRSESLSNKLYDHYISWDTKLIRVYGEQKDWFPHWPEHIFFRYLNSLCIATKPYLLNNQSNETPLKFSRHATTSFTENIFNLLQENNYSFLESDYPWEEEIASFIAAGGIPTQALQKLTLMNLSLLSDSSCITLYKVIDLLNHPVWLKTYRKSFLAQIANRGINPPSTLV
ncbi:hypothetical protein KBY93_15220 [Synechococcus sp. J7-Johnson]|uniref:hypothetical protein n=1 Tax=Synechococcus sp. J7-Johnson TaxID=2823737 RepID=UPI0020CE9AF3|nr:hypothetical protein [Synechococcus sp. J7-Johnson]MCP9841964.1 hypothetical protein [Synechococcus sp. J7-Johnson]